MDRNPISDLQAVAASPDLEVLAEMTAAMVDTDLDVADLMATLLFLAGRWTFGSANVCDSALRCTGLWGELRRSALSVGRVLPKNPPSFSKLHHLRSDLATELSDALASALPTVTVPLAKSLGLLDPAANSRWDRPASGNVIYGDGSVFKALSDVWVDDDGVVHGSRAKHTPRLPYLFEGKDGKKAGTGLPISLAGCHGRQRWMRVILGVTLFRDGNELGASLDLFDQIIALADGGVSHVVYDRLLSGTHQRKLMKMGVIPVVAMNEAAANLAHVVLPVELRRSGYRSAGTREKRKGKGARRRSGDDVAPKALLQVQSLRVIEPTPTRRCEHQLSALDGAVVSTPIGEDVTLDADYVDCHDLRWERRPDGWHPIGTLRVPCPNGPHRVDIDFAADRSTKKNRAGEPMALADWVRIIPETANHFEHIEGLRSDSESAFSWLKYMLPRARASSLHPDHFVLDLMGAALLCNAIAWDVHLAQHTECAQHEARLAARRVRREAA